MTQFISSLESCQEVQFPIMLTVMTDGERADYHLKKLYQLSLKSIGEIPQLDQPNDEQKEWVIDKMKSPSQAWHRWCVEVYFTEEQKKQLGITDLGIEGKGMR